MHYQSFIGKLMRVSDKAIVLQAIKYGDKKQILKLYTKHHGLLTAAVIVGNSLKSKIKSSITLPLNLLDVELLKKANKDIHQLSEANCTYVCTNISTSIFKLSIAQFINEILIRSLKEQPPNAHLFDFIEGCIKYLDECDESQINLHIYFLFEFAKYLGVEPNNNYNLQNCFFDCREGQFSSQSLSFPLGIDKEDSLLFHEALKVNCLDQKLSNTQRQKLLSILMAYYQMHEPGFNQIKSLQVLKEVFAA